MYSTGVVLQTERRCMVVQRDVRVGVNSSRSKDPTSTLR